MDCPPLKHKQRGHTRCSPRKTETLKPITLDQEETLAPKNPGSLQAVIPEKLIHAGTSWDE
jgi:hypothetical protein